jgi:hypothetical protein
MAIQNPELAKDAATSLLANYVLQWKGEGNLVTGDFKGFMESVSPEYLGYLAFRGGQGAASASIVNNAENFNQNVKLPKVFESTAAPWEKGATPNSIYVQLNEQGLIRSTTTYDNLGNFKIRTDFMQTNRHRVIINGQQLNLANYIHQHTKMQFVNPNNKPYLKDMVRIVDNNLNPTSEWVNGGK